jgi:hypothetical protein
MPHPPLTEFVEQHQGLSLAQFINIHYFTFSEESMQVPSLGIATLNSGTRHVKL